MFSRRGLAPPFKPGKTLGVKDEVPEPWWREWPLALAVVTLALALLGHGWIATALDQPALLVGLLAIICSVILAAAIAIVRHADELAHRLGEPAGTLLLTLAITGLEVAMVAFVMSTGSARQGRKQPADVRTFLSSLTGLGRAFPNREPSHKWLGYFQSRFQRRLLPEAQNQCGRAAGELKHLTARALQPISILGGTVIWF